MALGYIDPDLIPTSKGSRLRWGYGLDSYKEHFVRAFHGHRLTTEIVGCCHRVLVYGRTVGAGDDWDEAFDDAYEDLLRINDLD